MRHADDLAIRVRRSADIAVATDDGHVDRAAVAVAALDVQGLHCLLQHHQRGRAAFAIHVQLHVLLESPQRQLSTVAEVTVAPPGTQIIAQLQQHLLHQLHVLALAAILDDAVAQAVLYGMDSSFILRAIAEDNHGVATGLGHQDVTAPEVRALLLVLRTGQLGERTGLGKVAGHVPRTKPLR